jgi:hypothetical protein
VAPGAEHLVSRRLSRPPPVAWPVGPRTVKIKLASVSAKRSKIPHSSDFINDGVQVGQSAGSAHTHQDDLELQAGRTCSIDLEPHCSRDSVHRPRERIEAVKVGASISVDNQRVLAG